LTLSLSLSFSEAPSDTVQGSFPEFRPFSPEMTCHPEKGIKRREEREEKKREREERREETEEKKRKRGNEKKKTTQSPTPVFFIMILSP
jgi:hypothetical protein